MLTILPRAEARGYKCAAPTELLFLKAISLLRHDVNLNLLSNELPNQQLT